IVPASPIVPGDEYRGIVPVAARVAGRGISDRVNDRGDPRWSAAVIAFRVVRILTGGNHPAHASKLTGADVLQYIYRVQIDVIRPVFALAGSTWSCGLTDMLNGIWSGPDAARSRRIVPPGKGNRRRGIGEQVGHGLVLKARID